MKKKVLNCYLGLVLVVILAFAFKPFQANACFSLAAGWKATKDGSVLFAHNEDDGGDVVTRLHLVPRKFHEPGEQIEMWDTGTIMPQIEGETWAYIWSEMPNFSFSDSYRNEWGVSIASDACRSKEEYPYDVTQGGIKYWLRRLVAERAKTAYEGVLIMAEAVETYGYASSGRTYTVSDPRETWLFAVAGGRHWVAQRVPNEEVTVLSNRYNIRQVKLSDTKHFLACSDLIEYAIAKGWYNPASGEPFDFGKVYGQTSSQNGEYNTIRQWMGIYLLTDKNYPLDDLPFSIRPKHKVTVKDLIQVLRSHYEGTEYDQTTEEVLHTYGDPHHTPMRVICTRSTQESFVMQLRHKLPAIIGNIYWRTQGRPCQGVYIPWYWGILEIPKPYTVGEPSQYDAPLDIRYYDPHSAYWVFNRMNSLVDMDYLDRKAQVRSAWDPLEATEFKMQSTIEAKALKLYSHDHKHGNDKDSDGKKHTKKEGDEYLARQFLTRYTESLALKVYYDALGFIEQFEEQ